jgi:hypothetical protein
MSPSRRRRSARRASKFISSKVSEIALNKELSLKEQKQLEQMKALSELAKKIEKKR